MRNGLMLLLWKWTVKVKCFIVVKHIWYNWHFSSFKVTTQWHYAPSRCCATIASIQPAAFRVSERKSPPRKYPPDTPWVYMGSHQAPVRFPHES